MKTTRILITILILVLCMIPTAVFAAAETLPAGYAGNTDSLIDVKNPEAAVSTTTNKVCVVSAVAVPGTVVTLYSFDGAQYNKMYSEGKALEAEVGAAGLYAQSIELKNDVNTILVVATSGNSTETIKLDITVVKTDVVENIINIWQTLINN